ncbi:YggS family pyridoxal phosphate-dependent enzyme [Velocimicrobium porci]|uniref:Pyridoxal phosphate homeostasis protein n=1 Tax=Velocimicrobium porci TaxID=2606634 RepID=A0A6L5XZU9_9FIRM|nr:YggS family pyridoxal phosphate-dependent enzyme [Velocimicrobium porci]MSS64386.1 YggS family pyridoxal phosphate-dependent enzyme [Velocimicrobium porci]
MVKENLAFVEQKISDACKRVGRNRDEVTLIAVSKTKPVEMIQEAIEYGTVDFGENKVQEIVDKTQVIQDKVNWHMIGHLQRNKVKYIIDKVCLIHSVDSLRLAQQIEQEAAKKNIICPILIEVNVAKEETKYGVTVEETLPLITEIAKLPHVSIKGLMTIAPYVENSEENRIYFRKLHQLNIDIKSKNIDNVNMDILSMGMTGDYEVAIEEGATLVRVGTGIFGERNYNI